MKWVIKWFLRAALLLVILLVLFVLSINTIARNLIIHRIHACTGMDAEIGSVSVGLLSPEVTVQKLKVYNTAEFGGTPFLNVPELHVEYDPVALLKLHLHASLLRLNLAEADVVKNEKGRLNINATARKDANGKTPAAIPLFRFQFAGIDVLNLSLGKLRFVNLQNPTLNHDRVFDLQNQVHRNVKSASDLRGILFLLWLQSGATTFN